MNKDPNNPFNWRLRTEPSIFYKDITFRAKGPDGKSASQISAEFVENKRMQGIEPGAITGLGKPSKEKEARLLAYKQFGTYSKAVPSTKKPNKHEK